MASPTAVVLYYNKNPSLPICYQEIQRVLSNTIELPNGCLEWVGSFVKQSPQVIMQFERGNRPVSVTRLLYQLDKGEIPDDEILSKICHTKNCVNPSCYTINKKPTITIQEVVYYE